MIPFGPVSPKRKAAYEIVLGIVEENGNICDNSRRINMLGADVADVVKRLETRLGEDEFISSVTMCMRFDF